jgi:uncharacterized caspase-like protein
MKWLFLSAFGLVAGLSARPAFADAESPTAHAYALLIGSNQGGPGQEPLHYAEDDAQKVGDVLTSLAGYAASDVQRLVKPSASELRAALDALQGKLSAAAQAGEQSVLFLYYSGHARADALSLGAESLPLSELRERVMALPSTLSIVVLDACQSGAFSRVKGASAADDFSYNSVQRWNTEGVAVMASSSAIELSQESDELKSSYFTHHLLVALRGGGDSDRDGRVTLAEAYAYAYNHTLAETAATSVGEQHVTLETDLRGKGDVPITYPAQTQSRLRVPAEFEGKLILHKLPSWSVLAELQKAKGEPIELALPSGEYAATVRRGATVERCALRIGDSASTLDLSNGCHRIEDHETRAKGEVATHDWPAPAPDPGGDEGWGLELMVGAGGGDRDDAYAQRLVDFGFEAKGVTIGRYAFSATRRLLDHLGVGITFLNLDSADYKRDNQGIDQRFTWNSHAVGAFVQGDLSLGHHRLLVAFVRAGGGLAYGSTSFEEIVVDSAFADSDPAFDDVSAHTRKVHDSFTSYYLSASGGLQIMPWDNGGFQIEGNYVHAPALGNLTGETHDVGGFSFLIGVRLRTWE